MSNKLMQALLEAQSSCDGLTKDGTNSFAKFKYTSIEGVVKEARSILHKHDLAFYPRHQQLHVEGEDMWVEQTYELVHIPSGETKPIVRTMIVPPANKMSPCQAQGSAESYLLKNTLRELLLLPRFDSTEDLDSHDNTAKPYRRRQ